MVSIIAGNGINFGIIYMARYLEARRVQGKTPAEAVLVAHRDTWLATLAAAGAAMLSYGSLAITDFRGFKHFGIIGGAGMILCWIATYAFLAHDPGRLREDEPDVPQAESRCAPACAASTATASPGSPSAFPRGITIVR